MPDSVVESSISMNLKYIAPFVPFAVIGLFFLLLYTLTVVFLFSPNKGGRRRRWKVLDWLWVPLGGLTGVSFLALWWRMH
jgi:hypothetical protein